MKTTHDESMEELVFKNRNKEYGAYSLRKNYKNHLVIAMFIVVLFLGSALTYPLLMTPDQIVVPKGDTIVIKFTPFRKTEAEPLKLPPLQNATTVKLPKDLALRVPKVTDEPVENNDFGKQEVLESNKSTAVLNGEDISEATSVKSESVFTTPEKPEPLLVVPEMPHFPGTIAEMNAFLVTHIKYPREAKELGIVGIVFLSFVVESDGSITNITIIRGIGGGCEEEAVRVVKSMPTWIPGKQNNIAVRVRLTLPIKFKLLD
jgi:periplasmic protein TonB